MTTRAADVAQCYVDNSWICGQYWSDYRSELIDATVEHLKRTGADTFLTTLAYPIKGTPYYDEVKDRVVARQPWPARSDRDLVVAGRRSKSYYGFARRWMTSEVARHRHWMQGDYARAVRSAASAWAGRVGMALTAHQVESRGGL